MVRQLQTHIHLHKHVLMYFSHTNNKMKIKFVRSKDLPWKFSILLQIL